MKRLCVIFFAVLILIGCGKDDSSSKRSAAESGSGEKSGTVSTKLNNEPPSPSDMGIHRESYSFEDAAGLNSILLKMLQVPSRCEALNASGKSVRIAILEAFDQENGILTYEIQYSVYGLKSVAKFRLGTYRAILEETFPNKWLIKYEYNEEHPMKLGLPHSYSIYSYSPEHDRYERLVNKYTLHEKRPGVLRFRDSHGGLVDRDTLYFIVVPDQR